jgi:hypothetical protein
MGSCRQPPKMARILRRRDRVRHRSARIHTTVATNPIIAPAAARSSQISSASITRPPSDPLGMFKRARICLVPSARLCRRLGGAVRPAGLSHRAAWYRAQWEFRGRKTVWKDGRAKKLNESVGWFCHPEHFSDSRAFGVSSAVIFCGGGKRGIHDSPADKDGGRQSTACDPLDLFLRDKDPISIQCLACGGGEVVEAVAEAQGNKVFATHILSTQPEMDRKEIRRLRNQYWNAFKHYSDREDIRRDDEALLANFDDTVNDVSLYLGWWDYQVCCREAAGRRSSVSGLVQAVYEEKLAPDADLARIRRAFPTFDGKIGLSRSAGCGGRLRSTERITSGHPGLARSWSAHGPILLQKSVEEG